MYPPHLTWNRDGKTVAHRDNFQRDPEDRTTASFSSFRSDECQQESQLARDDEEDRSSLGTHLESGLLDNGIESRSSFRSQQESLLQQPEESKVRIEDVDLKWDDESNLRPRKKRELQAKLQKELQQQLQLHFKKILMPLMTPTPQTEPRALSPGANQEMAHHEVKETC